MSKMLVELLMLAGAAFMFLAALGVVRLPDLYIRMHAATKSGTLGVTCAIVAVALHFGDFAIAVRASLIVVFIFLTAPVAAHLVGRAAYQVGVPLWKRSIVDEGRGGPRDQK
ncbi:MAG: Na+/H+ antiporter subunit G [Candidatus Hydrogenedentes bacterium]|nr:Na+/H+ antiporter subunit G [Candidatus Hydrogenedentota bacterium]